MKNIGWLGIVFISICLGFSIGWTQSEKVDTIGEKKIHAIKNARLSIKKSDVVPTRIEVLQFHSEILAGISNAADKEYIKAQYTKGEDHYTLKENLTVEDKSKIYDIISSTGLDIIDAVDGCQ